MLIDSIELENFRNYGSLKLDLDGGINIFCGDNAQGKTNILEAVYLICTSKSQKLSKDRDMIRFGCDESHLKAVILKNEMRYRIDMHLKRNNSKGIAVNGIPIKKVSELLGIANVVSFSPEDLNIIKNGPSERRRFMDLELCQLNRIYVHDLISYNRVLNQKNRLLKNLQFDRSSEEFLDIYNEQLIKYGSEIISLRRSFVEKLDHLIRDFHSDITGNSERLTLKYEPDTTEESFYDDLKKHRDNELKNCFSLVGPHKDDIKFTFNDTDLRQYGSQGQQRTAVLSLKLAEIAFVEEVSGNRPLLLLDDVLSELDRNRQNKLLNSIKDIQTLITCTGLDDFVENRFRMDKVFLVKDGLLTVK